jgi:hypothetical protein
MTQEVLPDLLALFPMTYFCLVVDTGGAPPEQTLLDHLDEYTLVSSIVNKALSIQLMEVKWREATWHQSWWGVSKMTGPLSIKIDRLSLDKGRLMREHWLVA